MILNLLKEEINCIGIEKLTHYIKPQDIRDFTGAAGLEHYRLLAWISYQFNNEVLIDIGTHMGYSAMALSFNPLNKVLSYDIKDFNAPKRDNIEYKIGLIDELDFEKLIKSKFIFLDVSHDGIYENRIFQLLIEHNYNGFLMVDDLFLNKEMNNFWNNISHKKYNLTPIGHCSGTGLVCFGDNDITDENKAKA